MSTRKDFEEYCRRTRPPMSTAREWWTKGEADYIDGSTQSAWKAWRYLDKKYNPRLTICKGLTE